MRSSVLFENQASLALERACIYCVPDGRLWILPITQKSSAREVFTELASGIPVAIGTYKELRRAIEAKALYQDLPGGGCWIIPGAENLKPGQSFPPKKHLQACLSFMEQMDAHIRAQKPCKHLTSTRGEAHA